MLPRPEGPPNNHVDTVFNGPYRAVHYQDIDQTRMGWKCTQSTSISNILTCSFSGQDATNGTTAVTIDVFIVVTLLIAPFVAHFQSGYHGDFRSDQGDYHQQRFPM